MTAPAVQAAPRRRRGAVPWLVAAGVTFPLAVILLIVGLIQPNLTLVYVSMVASVAQIPLLVVGLLRLRAPAQEL